MGRTGGCHYDEGALDRSRSVLIILCNRYLAVLKTGHMDLLIWQMSYLISRRGVGGCYLEM